MDKIKAVLAVFRKGAVVANPRLWKQGQITATAVGALLIAVAQLGKVFGHDLNLDPDTASAVAGGVVAFVNWLCTLATSKHVGLPGLVPVPEPTPEPLPSPQKAQDDSEVSRFDEATRQRAEAFLRARNAGNPADRDFEVQ